LYLYTLEFNKWFFHLFRLFAENF